MFDRVLNQINWLVSIWWGVLVVNGLNLPFFWFQFNPFLTNAYILYPLKTPKNLWFFWCFQGVPNEYISQKRVIITFFKIAFEDKFYVRVCILHYQKKLIFIADCSERLITHFSPNVPFLYPLKTSESLRQPLKIWRDMVCLSRTYPFKFFKGCLGLLTFPGSIEMGH